MPAWVVRSLAVCIVGLLIAGAVGAAWDDDNTGNDDDVETSEPSEDRPDQSDDSDTTTTTADVAVTPQQRKTVVAEIQDFVENERGLKFKRPVKAEFLGDAAFRKRLLGDEGPTEEDRKDAEEVEGILRALGLIKGDVDLIEETEKVLGEGVLGFYSYKSKDLVVRATDLGPYARSVLAHELTHALDDQHFGLRRPKLDDDSEGSAAFQAVVEGNAPRVEEAYVDSLSDDEQDAVEDGESEAGGDIPFDIPRIILQSLAFPYQYGPTFVEEMLDRGDEEEVNKAFREPPSTTEQVLLTEKYFADEDAKQVPAPKPDGEKVTEDVVGLWFLSLMLDERIDQDDAIEASIGWGGDKLVSWQEGDRTCVRVNFVMDTDQDVEELRDALEEWAEDTDATVSGDDPLVFTSCG